MLHITAKGKKKQYKSIVESEVQEDEEINLNCIIIMLKNNSTTHNLVCNCSTPWTKTSKYEEKWGVK